MPVYDTVRVALQQLRESRVLERVAFEVLHPMHPQLRLTGPTGDMGRDAFTRVLFSDRDDLAVWVSLQKTWMTKARRELKGAAELPPAKRPPAAIFVTSQETKPQDQQTLKDEARAVGIALEIFDQDVLVPALESDALRRVAEELLSVRPRLPRALVPATEFLTRWGQNLPGATDALIGREGLLTSIQNFIEDEALTAARLLVIEGAGGLGKTRLAVEGASRSTSTFVARTAAVIDAESLRDVPLQASTRAVVIVDDIHRSEGLSGLTSMIGDPQYDRVRIIATARPGTAEAPLQRAGLEDVPRRTLPVTTLDRPEIDAIVTGHGIEDSTFIQFVIDLAQGSPLVAHAAAELYTTQHSFAWTDATDVLRDYVVKRLLPREVERPAEHRAVAVALAASIRSVGAEDLARLRGAVVGLPNTLERLEEVLSDLLDSGLADVATRTSAHAEPVYTLRPHLAGPVLLADALKSSPQDRVQLRLPRALLALGRSTVRTGASWEPEGEATPSPTSPREPLSIGRLDTARADGEWVDTALLANRLQVLTEATVQVAVHAEAAEHTEDAAAASAAAALLRRAVHELLPAHGDAQVWREMVSIAGQVVPAAPVLLEEVGTELLRQWPPPASTPSWGFMLPRQHQHELLAVIEAARDLITRVGDVDMRASVRLMLSLAAATDLEEAHLQAVTRAVTALALPGAGLRLTETEVHEHRAEVLRHVRTWAEEQISQTQGAQKAHGTQDSAPAATVAAAPTSDPGPRLTRHAIPVAAARVCLATLRPLLTPVMENTLWGSRESANAVTLWSGVLNDPQRTAEGLAAAAGLVSELIRRLDLVAVTAAGTAGGAADGEQTASLVRELVRLPGQLIAIGARGLPRTKGPLPKDTRHALAAAATIVRNAVAERWNELPLWARHAAAADSINTPGGPPQTLAYRARAGDVVAVTAATDRQLKDLLVLIPILTSRPRGVAAGQQALQRQHAAALKLAAKLGWQNAVQLLQESQLAHEDLTAGQRVPFAEEVGARIATVDAATTMLQHLLVREAVPAEEHLVLGLSRQHPTQVATWLLQICADWRGVDLLLRLLRLLPATVVEPVEREHLLDLLCQYLTAHPDDPRSMALGRDLALSLLRDSALGSGLSRVNRLIWLGLNGPAPLIPAVLQWATRPLRQANRLHPAPLTPDQTEVLTATKLHRPQLMQVLQRYLSVCDEHVLHRDDDTAHAVAALAVDVPQELADLLTPWLLDRLRNGNGWPSAWREALREVRPAQRNTFVTALSTGLDSQLLQQPLDELGTFTMQQALTQLAADTDHGSQRLLQQARGNATQRDRALATASSLESWHMTTWPDAVGELLQADISNRAREELLAALEVTTIGPDFDKYVTARLDVVRRIQPEANPAVRSFRHEAERRLTNALATHEADRERRQRGYQ